MATSGTFYVYEHWRLDRDECFYVGKGKGGRAYSMKDRNKHHRAICAKLNRIGSAFEVRIVASGLLEDEAFALECERIAFWRNYGCDLANLTNGGEGISGFKHSAETRQKLSVMNKGMPATFKGKKHTNETKIMLSEIAKKRGAPKLTKEQQEKAAAWHRGRKRSPETCAKISAKAQGRPSSQKGKPSSSKGTTRSTETCAKISDGRKKSWQQKREQNNGVLTGRKLSEDEKLQISIRKKEWWALKKMEKSNGN